MFLPNDVIRYTAQQRAVRVLYIERERGIVWTFELGQRHALPRAVPLPALSEDVFSGRARLLTDDPFAAHPAAAALPPRQRAQQAKAWDIVAGLQALAPALYLAHDRAAMVAHSAAAHGVSRPTVLRYLRRFWERGQTPDALLPDYGNSGARGRTRAANAGVKRGRPRTDGRQAGLNVDDDTRAVFRAAAARYRARHGTLARRDAYRQMLADFYRGQAPDAVPSFGQFSYWLDRDGTAREAGHAPSSIPKS